MVHVVNRRGCWLPTEIYVVAPALLWNCSVEEYLQNRHALRATSSHEAIGLRLNLSTKKTRKREFLVEMERVAPRAALVKLVKTDVPL